MSAAGLRRLITVSTVAALLAACASGGKPVPAPALQPTAPRSAGSDDASLRHFLDRLSFGSTPAEIAALKAAGVDAYLERQMHPERVDDRSLDERLARFETLALSSHDIADRYYRPAMEARRARQAAETASAPRGGVGQARQQTPIDQDLRRRERLVLEELSEQKLLRAVYSERQFQEVLVDFWFNHFNVFAGKGADRALVTAYERDVIRPHVFGTFRELLGATAESPAMLFYLDNWTSVDPAGPHPGAGGAVRRPGARTGVGGRLIPRPAQAAQRPRAARGINENYARELMELHTLGVDGGYTQRDVIEVARCFTGWTIAQPGQGGDFRFDARQHDPRPKVVLGRVIAAGGGKSDGEKVLDILAAYPSTSRFIATKLVRRFVSDTPPPALVDRVAKRFRETGGNLREVYRAIFLSPEFWSSASRAAKVKSPFEFVVTALRVSRADVRDARGAVEAVRALGMPLYGCPTPNGYGDTAETWINAGTLLNRLNVALAIAADRLPGAHVDLAALVGPDDANGARPRLTALLLGDRASAGTRSAVERAPALPQAGALLLGSPEFQRR